MRNFPLYVAVFVATATVTNAKANTISGSLWRVPESVVNSPTGATPGNVPGTAPDVTFDVNSPFNFSGSSVSIGTWLASSSAFNIVENTAGTLASPMDNFTEGTVIDFKGSVTITTGETFTVTHDDGLTLYIGGNLVVNRPQPTAPVTTTDTYSGPSGTLPFELVYTECCDGPAVLELSLPLSNTATIPEAGSTLMLLGLALAGVAAYRMRRVCA